MTHPTRRATSYAKSGGLVDRGGGGRVRAGRRDLRLPAKGPLRARPHGGPHGALELFLRDGHAHRRSRPAVAGVPARAAGAGTLGDVRSVMVRGSLRHDPVARVLAGPARAFRLHARDRGASALERRLCGGRRHVVRLPAVAEPVATPSPQPLVFGTLAWIFRARDEHAEPIMLAIAAVTLSTMHQSSLGSLYLLMPNMLAPQWWSPVMPVSFFLSSIAAGTALVILIDMWIAKGWRVRSR